jgi:hypothetical protein
MWNSDGMTRFLARALIAVIVDIALGESQCSAVG